VGRRNRRGRKEGWKIKDILEGQSEAVFGDTVRVDEKVN